MWGIQPGDFWRMNPQEFWWLVDARNPPQDDKWESLYRMLG